jgi:hypothetical protein
VRGIVGHASKTIIFSHTLEVRYRRAITSALACRSAAKGAHYYVLRNNMADACDLAQYTISKGGTVSVLGTCQSSQNWSALATDFLMTQLLAHPRYHRVICLDFENHNLDKRYDALHVLSGKRNASASRASKGGGDAMKKLTTIGARYSDKEQSFITDNASASRPNGLWDGILAVVARDVSNTVVPSNAQPSTSATIPAPSAGSVAVVVHSLSELILTVGFAETRSFVRKLTALLQETPSPSGSNHGTSSAPDSPSPTTEASPVPTAPVASASNTHVPCIILPVYQSLHSPAVLALVQGLASVLVRVVPNHGTLAETVACEIQTVRR